YPTVNRSRDFNGEREQPELSRRRWPRWRPLLLVGLMLAGLGGLTGWNLTRSSALDEARRAYARVDLYAALQHALDHLDRQPWSREAALVAANCLSRLDYSDQAEAYYQRAGRLSL